jgi:hypothetical protein
MHFFLNDARDQVALYRVFNVYRIHGIVTSSSVGYDCISCYTRQLTPYRRHNLARCNKVGDYRSINTVNWSLTIRCVIALTKYPAMLRVAERVKAGLPTPSHITSYGLGHRIYQQ